MAGSISHRPHRAARARAKLEPKSWTDRAGEGQRSRSVSTDQTHPVLALNGNIFQSGSSEPACANWRTLADRPTVTKTLAHALARARDPLAKPDGG
jgi:hypothetical protein